MRSSKVTVKRAPQPPATISYIELKNGSWYDSNSCYGLCIKLNADSFWSLELNKVVEVTHWSWPCVIVNVDIEYRAA